MGRVNESSHVFVKELHCITLINIFQISSSSFPFLWSRHKPRIADVRIYEYENLNVNVFFCVNIEREM